MAALEKTTTKTVQFKCPKCGYEWSITVASSNSISAHQRCPSCKRYSDNCEKPLNAWEALAEKLKKSGNQPMVVTYYCKKCNKEFKKDFIGKPDFKAKCPSCGEASPRKFGNVAFQKEDENVSGAIQMMLYSRKPSDQQSTNFL